MSEQRTRLHSLIEELENGNVINAEESDHLSRLIAQAIETVRRPMSRVEAREGMPPNERLAHYLQEQRDELAERLFQEFPDGGEKDREPMENVIRFMMNNYVFPEIAKEITFENREQARRFMLARFTTLLRHLDPLYRHGLASRIFNEKGNAEYWTKNANYVVTPESRRSSAQSFWEVCDQRHGSRIHTLEDAMQALSITTTDLVGKRDAGARAIAQSGYVFYKNLQGERPTGDVSILTINDYKDIIDRAIESLVVQKESTRLSMSVTDLPELQAAMEIFLKQQAIRGQVDTTLEGALFDGDTPATDFKKRHEAVPDTRWGLGKLLGLASKTSLEASIEEDVKAEVRALVVIADFIRDVHEAGLTKQKMGVDDEQRELGSIKIEFARLYLKEWRRRCIDYHANTPIRESLALLLHEVEDMLEKSETASIDARLKRAADAEIDDLTDERRQEEGLDRVRRATVARQAKLKQ